MSNANPALSESDEPNYTALGNILGILIGFVSPLIFWLIYKDRSAFVDRNLKSALNFQISVVIYFIAAGILSVIIPSQEIILKIPLVCWSSSSASWRL